MKVKSAVVAILIAGSVVSFQGRCLAQAPKAAVLAKDLSELAAAWRPFGRFVRASGIHAQKPGEGSQYDPQAWAPVRAISPILALEDNQHFLLATCNVSDAAGDSQPGPADKPKTKMVRRLFFLKPSLLVVDDVVPREAPDARWRWLLDCRVEPTSQNRQLRMSDSGEDLACTILWPATAVLRTKPRAKDATGPGAIIEVERGVNAGPVRCLQVYQLLRPGEGGGPAKFVLNNNDGCLDLTVTTRDRNLQLALPGVGSDAGHISLESADGKVLAPRRPLPAGILPHGPQGMRLIERWDRDYRDGRRPAWDTGVVSTELKRVVEEGVVRPCRTVELGCGSGTNAIYLAGKGFDVTAIDVAPTSLGIAEANAKKAGVRVRWLLADVLALPDLGQFEFIFDRGCYHNVRYVNAAGFVDAAKQLSRPGTQFLILSLNRDGPPGVRERHMRDDFSSLFEFTYLREGGIELGKDGKGRPQSWSAMLRRKE